MMTKYPAMFCTCTQVIHFDGTHWLTADGSNGHDGHRHFPHVDRVRELHTLSCGHLLADHVRNGGCRDSFGS